MIYQKIKNFSEKYHPLSLTFILILGITTLVGARLVRQQQANLRSQAAINQAHITVAPSQAQMPPDQTFKIFIDPNTTPLVFTHIDIEFDPLATKLQTDPQISSSFDRIIFTTPLTDANVSGKLSLVAAVGPTREAVIQTLEFATLIFTSATEDPETATIAVNTQTSKLVSGQGQLFNLTADPATVELNKPPTPSPVVEPTKTVTPTITIIPGQSLDLTPIDDTFVLPGRPEKTNGSSRALEVDGQPVKIIYMKFDLSQIPTSVEKAVLTLRITNTSNSTQDLKEVENNSWQENTLNYNNKPPTGNLLTHTQGGKRGDDIQIDLTEYIKRKAGSTASLAFEQNGGNGFDFYSKDAQSDKPRLTIQLANVATPTQTPSGSSGADSLNLTPLADTFTSDRFPDKNNGKENEIEVDGEPLKTAYLKFDLSALAGKNINNAQLRLTVSDTSNAQELIISGVDDSSWQEDQVTYNAKPATGGVLAKFSGAKAGDTVTIDLTEYVGKFAGKTMSIAIDNSKDGDHSGDGMDFKSKDASEGKPVLIVTTN